MDLLHAFIKQVDQLPQARSTRYLLAVSGGVDSVVLCDLFHKAGMAFIIAHCNFKLRGEESERDEQFVRSLAKSYGVEIMVNDFDTAGYAALHKQSIQVAARNLRYDWFRHLVVEDKLAGKIVTAHHADDNIETVVMNFFRGTGINGLIGMDQQFALLYRPLLNFRKKNLQEYAHLHLLNYVEDSSNISSNYTRNYFRNELLPAISEVFPAVEENILNNISRLSDVHQVYSAAINEKKAKLVHAKGEEEHIPILQLIKLSYAKTITWEIIKERGFRAAQVDEVIKLANASNGSFIENEHWRIIKNRKWLIISPKAKEENTTHQVITEDQNTISFGGGNLRIEKEVPLHKLALEPATHIAVFDLSEITFPLLVRKYRQGDYFYPLGMQRKKKISRFLIDQKLSAIDKENTWVVESDGRIMWVMGYRIDDRFKLKTSTSAVMKITWKPAI